MREAKMGRRQFVATMGAVGALSVAAELDVATLGIADETAFPKPAVGNPIEAKVDVKTGEVQVNEDVIVRNSTCVGCYQSCGNRIKLDRETGMLKNFIADLEGTYKQQVEALSLGEFVTCMKEANERVNRLLDQRGNEQLGTTVGALKASRKATDEACRMLVKMVNALALVEGEKDYAAFIDRTNTEIVRYKREVLGQASAPAGTGGSGSGSDSGTGGGTGTGGSGNTGGGSDGGDAMV